jgi:PiT family inorganic phosphate transporter
MTSIPSTDIASAPSEIARPKLDQPMGIKTILIFFAIMALGLFFTAYSIHKDLTAAGTPITSYLPFLLLGDSSRSASNSTVSTTPPMRSQP